MLEIAEGKFTSDESVTFQPIDAMDISLPDKSVDLVLCQFGVMFFPDKVASYKEARRVLKRGGRYIFNAWGSHEENPFAAIGQGIIEDLFPTNTPQFYNVPFHYHDPKQMKKDMKSAGFSSVKVKRMPIKKAIHSIDDFVEGFVFGNPLAEQIAAHDGDPAEVVQRLRAAFLKEFKGNPPKMPLCAYFVSGKK
jgi:ubiquinone/menaquinone biosynthesis C-methylase UbiE